MFVFSSQSTGGVLFKEFLKSGGSKFMERFDMGKMPNYIVTKTQSSVGALGEVGPQPNALRCLQPHSRANSGSLHP